MADVEIGIIGGTGTYDPSAMLDREEISVDTKFGKPSDDLVIGTLFGRRIAFLPRHGRKHSLPPHKVPYRANIAALKQLGVSRIIAPSAVGSLNPGLPLGSIVVPDQFVDFSKGRSCSFYDDEAVHVSMANPFCNELAGTAARAALSKKIKVNIKGTYVSIEGPRFSAKAESIFYKDVLRGDIIGMTLVPEVILAREAEICYLTLATVTDYDAWEHKPVSAEMVSEAMKISSEQVRMLMGELISNVPKDRGCECKHALADARL